MSGSRVRLKVVCRGCIIADIDLWQFVMRAIEQQGVYLMDEHKKEAQINIESAFGTLIARGPNPFLIEGDKG